MGPIPRWALVSVALAVAAGSASGQGVVGGDGLAEALERLIPGTLEAYGVPGLNVLVLRAGRVALEASYGWADPAAGRPMTLDAVFRVESISKPVTAWGVTRLAEVGTLDLDGPVQGQLISWPMPPDVPPITPRQLLSHTAGVGLGDYSARYAPEGPRPTLVASLEAEWAMVGPPGARFAYSDTGYNLLELLVQDVTGEDFGTWMEANVLLPSGMEEASFDWRRSFAHRVPRGHDLRGRGVDPYVYPGRGSGGLFATVRDVGRFLQAGMRRDHGGAGVRMLHVPHTRPSGLYALVAEGYGLGHFTETLSDGRAAVWHGGQGYGWMTHFHLVPETGDAIVLLANSQRAWPLFAHVLRAWSAELGVEPVRMARVAWAAPLAWFVIALCLAGGTGLCMRAASRRRRRPTPGGRSGPGIPLRVLAVTAAAALTSAVGWASVQDYLFLFSILPATTGWLALAVMVLSAGLCAWAVVPCPRRGSAGRDPTMGPGARWAPGVIFTMVLAGGGAAEVAAQVPVVHLEASWMPSSDVTRSLSGPAATARVALLRGSALVPLVLQRDGLVVAPRISWSRVAVTPRPLDPAEPVWVESLYDVDLEVIGQAALSPRTALSVVLAPGIASDFRNVRSGHLTAQGALLVTRTSPGRPTWGGGVSVTNAFGELLAVPLLAFQWRSEGMWAEVLAPAQAEFFRSFGDRLAVGLQAAVDGNVYGLGREGTLQGGRVRYSLADIGPALRYDFGGGLRLSGSCGVSFRRRLEVEDAHGRLVENAALTRGLRLGLAFSWLLPPR